MSCREIQSRLHDYIEEALSESGRDRIETHLNSCADCRSVLADMQASIAMSRDLDEIEPPPFFATRIMAHVRSAGQKRSWPGKLFLAPIRIPAGVLAAALILLTGLLFTTMWMPAQRTDQRPLISDNTSRRLPEDLLNPDRSQGPLDILTDHPLQDARLQRPPDVHVTLGVPAIDHTANEVLRRLIDMDARILHISSGKGEYRIIADINTGTKKDLLRFLERIDRDMEITGGLGSQENTLVSITFLQQPTNP